MYLHQHLQPSKKELLVAVTKEHSEIAKKACEVISKSNGHLKAALACAPKKFN